MFFVEKEKKKNLFLFPQSVESKYLLKTQLNMIPMNIKEGDASSSSTVSGNLAASVSVSFSAVLRRCFCHHGLNTLGASQHQVFSFYIQMTLCITCSCEIRVWGVYVRSCMSTAIFFFCLLCALFGGFAYGLFMQVIPLRETLCQGRASVQSACILYSHMI